MGIPAFGRGALGVALAVFLLSGCGGWQTGLNVGKETTQILSGGPTPNQGAPLVHRAPSSYRVIYSLQGGNDGAFPQPEAAPLIPSLAVYWVGGKLYSSSAERRALDG